MFKKVRAAFAMAFDNIRTNFFHTILSVLGIVIGVAALVAILSLIDGLEKYAADQIQQTTSLQAVIFQPQPYERIDGVRLRKDSLEYIDYQRFKALKSAVGPVQRFTLESRMPTQIQHSDTLVAAIIRSGVFFNNQDTSFLFGHGISEEMVETAQAVAYVTETLAKKLGDGEQPSSGLGQSFSFNNHKFEVIGIVADPENTPVKQVASLPITLMQSKQLQQYPPMMAVEAPDVEAVNAIKEKAEQWLTTNLGEDQTDIKVMTNDFRLEQVEKGFLLFRVIMGLIVGISVLVGGIGVMNVLLISVKERTVEIGLRKAIGATRRDITTQFITESITVSIFGSLLGLLLGVLGTLAILPIVKLVVDVPFSASFTLDTLLVISVVAILTGLIFGTYPATKAAKLDPVEAIRRE